MKKIVLMINLLLFSLYGEIASGQVNPVTKYIESLDIEGTFVINIGDLLARWSNGRFESTLHRVINSSTQARYSLAMFVDPNWNATIKPLIQDGEYANYDTVKCADYINARYDEAFEYRKIRNE